MFTLSSATTEDDVGSVIFDEDYEYLDDVIECEEDMIDHVTDHVIYKFPVTDNAAGDILTNDVATATNFPVDTGTEDRAEICPDILDSAKTVLQKLKMTSPLAFSMLTTTLLLKMSPLMPRF